MEIQAIRQAAPDGAGRRARLATTAAFAVNAVLMGAWVPRIPEVKDRLHLSAAELGFALLGTAVGSLLATLFIGRLCTRWGSGRVTVVATVGYCLVGWLVGIAANAVMLALALLVWGLAMGSLDVAMNTQGVTVEKAYRRPVLSSFHAAFSIGTLAGALLGGIGAAVRAPLVGQQLVIGLVLLVLALPTTRWYLPDPAHDAPAAQPPPVSRRRRPRLPALSARIVLLGLASVCALLSEGAVADWSGVLLRDALGAGPGQVGFGFAAFATTMTIGRLTGDRVVGAFGRARSVAVLGGLGALGCAAGLASGTLVGVVIGFGFLGVGLATMFPTYLSAAADTDAPAGPLLATVTGLGYSGFLIGPTMIGLVAQASSVLSALWLVPVLTAASIGMGLAGIRLTRRALPAGEVVPAPSLSH